MDNKRLRPFIFAYQSILLNFEQKSIISNEDMTKYTLESHENKLINISIVEMGYLKLKGKAKAADMPCNFKFRKSFMEKIHECLFYE